MELVIASSSVDSGISCWDLHSGAEQIRYRSCTSPPHGLTCLGTRFVASSQLRDSSSSSGSILYWPWNKPQAEVRSFPAEPINPLICNRAATYIIGGGLSGDIYFWEVASGKLLKRWHAHYRAVTRLLLSQDDESLLISGSEDGSVRVWSLFMVFDDIGNKVAKNAYEHSFSEHTLRVTDIVSGYGGGNAIIISSSEDRTCKVWSISTGKLVRNIVFPSIIDALALDPAEHVFYAGGRDGKIYIAALTAERTSSSSYGLHIIDALFDHSKPVTSLAFSMDGKLLVSGLVDGVIRIWDTRSRQIVRVFRHSKGPVNNILIVRQSHPQISVTTQASRRHASFAPPPLDKYVESKEEKVDFQPVVCLHPSNGPLDAKYLSTHVTKNQIKELQQQGSSAASAMELEKLKLDKERSWQVNQQLKKMCDGLHEFFVDVLGEAAMETLPRIDT